MLNIELGQYAIEIQQYKYLYEQELTAFKSETCKINSPYQMCRLIHQIRYKESCLHVKLLRRHHHQLLSTQKNIDVYPEIIIDVTKIH